MGIKQYIKVIITTLILVNTILISYSVNDNIIDLTELNSGNGESSHSHIWVETYNDTHHWQQCSLCSAEQNKNVHSLTSKNTMGNSCNDSNMTITTCTNCEYYSEVKTNYGHTFSYLEHWIEANGNKHYLQSRCGNCGAAYARSDQGYKYYYSNNTEVDPSNIILPNTIKNQWRNSSYLTERSLKWVTITDDITVNYNITNNSTLNITAYIKVPSEITSKLSTSQINNNSYAFTYGWIRNLGYGKETTGYLINPNYRSYNASTQIMELRFSVNIRDWAKNYMTCGYAAVAVRFKIPSGNAYNCYLYEKNSNIYTNFADVVINSVK